MKLKRSTTTVSREYRLYGILFRLHPPRGFSYSALPRISRFSGSLPCVGRGLDWIAYSDFPFRRSSFPRLRSKEKYRLLDELSEKRHAAVLAQSIESLGSLVPNARVDQGVRQIVVEPGGVEPPPIEGPLSALINRKPCRSHKWWTRWVLPPGLAHRHIQDLCLQPSPRPFIRHALTT